MPTEQRTKRRLIIQTKASPDDLIGFVSTEWTYPNLVNKVQVLLLEKVTHKPEQFPW
jgi:hypothetical protein